jgi:histidine triad (HIT) family protein
MSLFSHEPKEYRCPFCAMMDGESHIIDPNLVYEDELIFSVISLHWWTNNPGHALVIPKRHIENIYELPSPLSDRIHRFSRYLALAMKSVHNCDGITIWQNNEPAGSQDVWHYHLHVVPRFTGDNLHRSEFSIAPADQRQRYASLLRQHFTANMPVF